MGLGGYRDHVGETRSQSSIVRLAMERILCTTGPPATLAAPGGTGHNLRRAPRRSWTWAWVSSPLQRWWRVGEPILARDAGDAGQGLCVGDRGACRRSYRCVMIHAIPHWFLGDGCVVFTALAWACVAFHGRAQARVNLRSPDPQSSLHTVSRKRRTLHDFVRACSSRCSWSSC